METKHNETATAHEWDEMRAQWAVLNRKLSNEPLVDDRHIRESMGKRTEWIGDKVRLERAFAPLISAALIGRNHPLGAVFGALFFAWMEAGGKAAMLQTSTSFDLSSIVQGIAFILITVDFFRQKRGGSPV